MNFDELKDILSKPCKVVVTNHVRPDADAIGSALALYRFLYQFMNLQVELVFPSDYSPMYRWFPGIKKALVWDRDLKKIRKTIADAELAIVVDFNEISRNGEVGKLLAKRDIPKVLIDHHTEPEDVFDYRIWSTSFAAAAEGVFHFISDIYPAALHDKTIATCLYAAIVADSGSFRFQYTGPETHRIAARLLDTGIDHTEIHRRLFDNFSENKTRMWGFAIYKKMMVLPDIPVVLIPVSLAEFNRFKGIPGDTEGLVNFPLSMNNIEVSVLIIEKIDVVKISIRSKTTFPANEFARHYFGGGGHVNAAGAESNDNLSHTVKKLEENIREFWEQLKS